MSITVALAGNPNVGKSTLFNALTGSNQHVGNWPGKTVEKKEGVLHIAGQKIILVDLPGTYSLNAFSIEELIARDFIIQEQPNAVVAVVDSTNLERNLYLVAQLLEMNVPLVLVLNMSDLAESRGIAIDPTELSEKLGIPVVQTAGKRTIGLEALRNAIASTLGKKYPQITTEFNPLLEAEINSLQKMCQEIPELRVYPSRWLAIKLLESGEDILSHYPALQIAVEATAMRIRESIGEDPDILIADARYSFISQIVKMAVNRPPQATHTSSDKIDRILTHRIWGLPIFLVLMWVVFQFTANVSTPMVDWIDGVIQNLLAHRVMAFFQLIGLENSWLERLLIDGVITGVGGVLVFVPVLFSLYFAIALLEDSGYMARAAFVMDRVMQGLGLHGKSFLPLLVGFGCNVPAVYATRTLEDEIDRKITSFLVSFMSCGARLPIYVLMGAIFFESTTGNFVFAMYLVGIAVAILTSLLMTKVVFRGRSTPPFIMELPPYHVPNFRFILRQARDRTMMFVREAGTIILSISILIWLLSAIPTTGKDQFGATPIENSLLAKTSQGVAPIFEPAGFGNWQNVSALVTGIAAKEVVISAMNQVYTHEETEDETLPTFGDDLQATGTSLGETMIATGQETLNIPLRLINLLPIVNVPLLETATPEEDDSSLKSSLADHFSPMAAVAFSIFVLLYTPCMATLAALRQEFGTRWMVLQAIYTFIVAWSVAVLVYQMGSRLT